MYKEKQLIVPLYRVEKNHDFKKKSDFFALNRIYLFFLNLVYRYLYRCLNL